VRSGPALTRFPAMMWGIFFLCVGFADYVLGVLLAALRHFLSPGLPVAEISRAMLSYGGMPVVGGILLTVLELAVLLPHKRLMNEVPFDIVRNRTLPSF